MSGTRSVPVVSDQGPPGPAGPGSTWLTLPETPGSFSGQSGKLISVNSTESALEFSDLQGSTLLSFNNDADAGTGGLTSGDLWKTSATNTLGLPAGVVLVKA